MSKRDIIPASRRRGSRTIISFLANLEDHEFRQADATLEALIALETHLEMTERQVAEMAS